MNIAYILNVQVSVVSVHSSGVVQGERGVQLGGMGVKLCGGGVSPSSGIRVQPGVAETATRRAPKGVLALESSGAYL